MSASKPDQSSINFIEFSDSSEAGVSGSGRAAGLTLCRPHLSTDRQTVYEDTQRSTQVLSEMHRFYQNGRLCDIVLFAEDSRYTCHRLVLAASSLYFESMFSNGMLEASAPEIRLNDVTAQALQHLIDFAYTSKLTLNSECVLETFEAADMLQFQRVREFCTDFLSEQVDEMNCLSFLLYADAFACPPLYDRAMLHAAKHFQAVCRLPDFLTLPMPHLTTLLRDDNLEVEYEESVYESLKRWVEHDTDSRLVHLPSLFAHIRLNFVSRWYLIEVISKDAMLRGCAECWRTVQSAKDQLLAQGRTYEIPWQLPPSRKCTGLTKKIVYVNTYDPYPKESEVFLFDVVNKSWSNTGRPCPMASELSTCLSLGGDSTASGGGGDSLLVIGGWTSATGNKSLNQRGAVNVIHEFKVMSIFPTLWYVGTHQMSISRYLHATVAVGSHIYILGGYDETQTLQSSVFVADTAANASSAPLGGPAVTAGGSMFSGAMFRFEACPPMPYPVSRPAVAYWSDRIYVFGGFTWECEPTQVVQCFHRAIQSWTIVKPGIPPGKKGQRAAQYAAFIDGLFYVVCGTVRGELVGAGGSSEDGLSCSGHRAARKVVDCILSFDPVSRDWKKVYSFVDARYGSLSVATLDGKLFLAGGCKSGTRCHSIDCFDPSTLTLDTVGSTREGPGSLSLCTTLRAMHENFGL